jgi:8-oxo-dGTP pyrophosphatase MutT (NUDIX family)
MYKIFFGTRCIIISSLNENDYGQNIQALIKCKNNKSFDNLYTDFQKDETITCLSISNSNPKKLFRHFKKKFKVIKAAGGLIENSEGKILIMKRNGVWDLPKGKIEKGEKKKQAALREVEEECGISDLKILSRINDSFHTYKCNETEVLKITYWYRMLYNGIEVPVPQTIEGISEIKWVDKNELREIKEIIYPNLRDVIDCILFD